jgi:hypothetical protein
MTGQILQSAIRAAAQSIDVANGRLPHSCRGSSQKALSQALLPMAAIWLTLGSGALQAEDEQMLYVENVNVVAPIKEDGSLLSITLCAELSKSAKHSVVCEPDLKQMMDFAALNTIIGNGNKKLNNLENTLANVNVLVFSELRNGKFGYILYLEVAERDPSMEGATLLPKKVLGRYKIKGIKRDTKSVLQALERLSPRIATLLAPNHQGGEPPSAASPM